MECSRASVLTKCLPTAPACASDVEAREQELGVRQGGHRGADLHA